MNLKTGVFTCPGIKLFYFGSSSQVKRFYIDLSFVVSKGYQLNKSINIIYSTIRSKIQLVAQLVQDISRFLRKKIIVHALPHSIGKEDLML